MAEYAYTTVPSKLRPFLEKIRDVGVPPKVTQAWLASIGFSSTNDRSLVSVMKLVGFIDAGGRPTDAWEAYRGGRRDALATGIRSGFALLFETYPDAQVRSNADLESVVKSSAPKLGRETVSRVVSTFKHLVALADFAAVEDAGERERTERRRSMADEPDIALPAAIRYGGTGVTIHINVQLTLPATTDGSVYEKLFAAMRAHLLEGMTDGP
ncbi:MAG: DUF5343 domain-containing protein [Chloroflexia bacterium]|nr:DUF5343 domain-containing protein [Chloroflexia bacterium]